MTFLPRVQCLSGLNYILSPIITPRPTRTNGGDVGFFMLRSVQRILTEAKTKETDRVTSVGRCDERLYLLYPPRKGRNRTRSLQGLRLTLHLVLMILPLPTWLLVVDCGSPINGVWVESTSYNEQCERSTPTTKYLTDFQLSSLKVSRNSCPKDCFFEFKSI